MGNLVLNGSTSGSITVSPTAIAGSNTLTLPAKTGNIITSADSGTVTQTMLASGTVGAGPSMRAYGSANQTGLTSATYYKLSLNTKTGAGGWDTASCYDATTNYRFTPNVAGYYLCICAVYLSSPSSTLTGMQVSFYKNGTSVSVPCFSTYTSAQAFVNGSDVIYCNGTTDYIEFWAYASTTTGTYSVIAGTTYTYGTATLIRSA